MRTEERRWHFRLWLVIGPACVVAIVAAGWKRPPEPNSDGQLDVPRDRAANEPARIEGDSKDQPEAP